MSNLAPPPVSLLNPYTGSQFHPLYRTTVVVAGGSANHARSSGIAESDDGNLKLDLRLPKELGGAGGGTNPEQLFAAGYAACFHGALVLVATKRRIAIAGATISASATFGRDPKDGLYALELDVLVDIPGVDQKTAASLVEETETICPYAKASRQGFTSRVSLKHPS